MRVIARRRRSLAPLAIAFAAIAACGGGTVGSDSNDVVMGKDDRQDFYDVTDARIRELTQRTVVALIEDPHLDTSDPTDVKIVAPTLREREGLCDGQRFLDDPTAAHCTGTLIGDDQVLTAGHCIDATNPCSGMWFVFGYYNEAPGKLHKITSLDIFRCVDVLARFDGLTDQGNLDHAIVRLDRPAAPRFLPIAPRTTIDPLAANAPLAVISFGSGIPAKIDLGSRVIDARATTLDYFLTDSDTFVHSSGAGVFDRAGTEVEGIIVRGERDYVTTAAGCSIVNACDNGCDGKYEQASYAYHAVDDMCATLGDQSASEPLCQ